MISGFGKSRPSWPLALLLLLAAGAFVAGCSSGNTTGGGGTAGGHLLPSGSSVPGWTVPTGGSQHAIAATQEYASDGSLVSCTDCHGPDLRGGISRTSCFGNPAGCHHGTIAGWVAAPPAAQQHGVWAKRAIGDGSFFACRLCHGGSFSGGRAQASCFTCHGVSAPHPPAPWRGAGYTHADTDPSNAPVCAQCHYPGSPNNPAGHPATPAPAGTAPGCYNGTMCHNQTGHPAPYNLPSHYAADNAIFMSNCSSCHDVSPPSAKSGPACVTCHAAGSPLTLLGCTSCHASPPSSGVPPGAVYPNIAGAHATHLSLNSAGSPVSCDTCHSGLGPSLQNLAHYDRVRSRVPPGDVAFLSTYDAKTGTSSFLAGALTCADVSCHGGMTPDWRDGRIDASGHCALCHTFGTTQYNSYNSGPGIASAVGPHHTAAADCVHCHDTAALAVNHFTSLGTPAMEGPASATIGGGTTSIPAGNYIPATRTCTPACHGISGW